MQTYWLLSFSGCQSEEKLNHPVLVIIAKKEGHCSGLIRSRYLFLFFGIAGEGLTMPSNRVPWMPHF